VSTFVSTLTGAPRSRGLFANRTLNLRSIRAIGYDMDYTVVHYRVEEWERRAYEHLRECLAARGWPVADLEFDSDLVIRGLVVDTQLGNVVKANRFGFVKRAFHGTRLLEFEEQRALYGRVVVDLGEPRWQFLNTLFSLSEACMYMQLCDRLDRRELPGAIGYADLYEIVRESIDRTHMEGRLKEEIAADPDRFVVLEAETPLALLDQKHAGKKLMLITNSEWPYTAAMMSYAFDRFLPDGIKWRDLFDVVIVGAAKPGFFTASSPLFEVVSEDGLLRPAVGGLHAGACFLGGSAPLVERFLGVSGDEILYVGDHIFGDVRMSKSVLRWRTGLILAELEEEIAATEAMASEEARLSELMLEKEQLEAKLCALRLNLQRNRARYAPATGDDTTIQSEMALLRERLAALDLIIAPLAKRASEVSNPNWGLLMRAGNDKSHLARQVERSADIYTSRVSNFLYATPFAFLRAPRGTLPHDVAALPASEAEARSGKV
jgi:HAD superfamily 5'-nucleotidase-like hydrolase